jgi:branched-chain amino acid aminotransferase
MADTGTEDEIGFDIQPSSDPTSPADRAQALESPGFGRVYTDHMVTIRWSAERGGWHDARLEPYGPLRLDPSASVFHYGQEIFEGLKAYRQASGAIATFRPDASAARFRRSAARLGMPELPESAFIRAIELLVTQDKDWVPTAEDHTLYLRPFMIATEPNIAEDHPSATYLFMLIASPVGSYFPRGVQPVTVGVSKDYSRAGPGGTGAVKVGANYGPTFAAQQQAVEMGCDQVAWLDAIEHRWVEELGGMNLMFVYGNSSRARIMTPQLTGTLLPGITRDSLLKLSPDLGIPVSEGRISIDQWQSEAESGEITETFACGSAAVITPVGKVKYGSIEWTIGDGGKGPVSMRLRKHLIDIQFGNLPDPYGWIHPIC